jgi:hypothetical protein
MMPTKSRTKTLLIEFADGAELPQDYELVGAIH